MPVLGRAPPGRITDFHQGGFHSGEWARECLLTNFANARVGGLRTRLAPLQSGSRQNHLPQKHPSRSHVPCYDGNGHLGRPIVGKSMGPMSDTEIHWGSRIALGWCPPDTPLPRCLYAQLRRAMLTGRLKRGMRLPATREFAGHMGYYPAWWSTSSSSC